MKLRNINKISEPSGKCGSWLKHWEKFSGQKIPPYCPVSVCMKTDLAGAFVQKGTGTDRSWYIIPLCSDHSRPTVELEINDDVKLVPADKKETCEK